MRLPSLIAPVCLAAALLPGCASVETSAPAKAGSGGAQPGAVSPLRPRASAAPALGSAAKPSPLPWLKGQTHVHTDRSHDGHTPPQRVLSYYAARGYDFVALTDHNRVTVLDAPKGLLLLPGVELTQNSKSCDPKPPEGYRCLIHTTALFVDPTRVRVGDKRIVFPFVDQRRAAYSAQMQMAEGWGAITVLNHPLFHFAANEKMVHALSSSGLRFIELINAGLDQQHPRGRAAAEDRAEALWDAALTRGARVFALATDDSHHFDDEADRKRLGKFAYTGDRAWIHVRAKKELADIRRALLAGDFYASTGVRLEDVTRTRSEMTVRVSAPQSCSIRFIGAGGKELARKACPSASFALGAEPYVRATVVAPDGSKAWLQPVFARKKP